MTIDDWRGNELADKLAKKGARTHRVPRWIRARRELAYNAAFRAAVQLGIVTDAANNHSCTHTKPDGSQSQTTHRDSTGLSSQKRKRASNAECGGNTVTVG